MFICISLALITKAEFDSALADFNSRLTTFEAGINSKIDSQVTSYLDRNGIWNGKVQTMENKSWYVKKANFPFGASQKFPKTETHKVIYGEDYTMTKAGLLYVDFRWTIKLNANSRAYIGYKGAGSERDAVSWIGILFYDYNIDKTTCTEEFRLAITGDIESDVNLCSYLSTDVAMINLGANIQRTSTHFVTKGEKRFQMEWVYYGIDTSYTFDTALASPWTNDTTDKVWNCWMPAYKVY